MDRNTKCGRSMTARRRTARSKRYVTRAQQWSASVAGAVVAFMNPGGVRSDLTDASSQDPADSSDIFSPDQLTISLDVP
jgi:hypothetical protein